MKKILAAVICIAITTGSMLASGKGHPQHQGLQVGPPEIEVRQPQRQHHDPVVDMSIIKDLGLSKIKIAQIEELQQRKQQEMAAHRPMKKEHKAMHQKAHQKAAPAHHHSMDPKQKEKMAAFKASYRKELRSIMGTEKYLTYLERYSDKKATAHKHHHRHGAQKVQEQTTPRAQSGRRSA